MDAALERHAGAGLAALAEVGPVPGADAGEDVEQDEPCDQRGDDALGPVLGEAGVGAADDPAEERRPLAVGLVQVDRDPPAVVDHTVAVEQDRDEALARGGKRALLGEAPRDGLERQALVGQRHPGPPAVGAEPHGRVGGAKVVEAERGGRLGHGRVSDAIGSWAAAAGLPTGSPTGKAGLVRNPTAEPPRLRSKVPFITRERTMSNDRLLAVAGAVALLAAAAPPHAATTELVSANTAGQEGNDNSFDPSLSGDGHYVTFDSIATNLANGVGSDHVYLRDRIARTTTAVDVSTSGQLANSFSFGALISRDGSHVAFFSNASNLVAGDTNGEGDVFERDLKTGNTVRVSVKSNGQEPHNSGIMEQAHQAPLFTSG